MEIIAPTATSPWPVVPPVPRPSPPPTTALAPEPVIRPYSRVTTPVPMLPLRGGVALRVRPARRPVVVPSRADNLVWQPRFAYTSAAVILVIFALVATPLAIVLYRMATSPGVPLDQLLPMGMMLLGGFLTAVTAWVVVVELRARVRMVDALGRTGEHEAPGAAAPAVAGLLRPFAQVPAHAVLLVVALFLFVGATLIAL